MNGTAADNVEIELKAKLGRQTIAVQNLISSSGGIIQFNIPPISDHIDTMTLEVHEFYDYLKSYWIKFCFRLAGSGI